MIIYFISYYSIIYIYVNNRRSTIFKSEILALSIEDQFYKYNLKWTVIKISFIDIDLTFW